MQWLELLSGACFFKLVESFSPLLKFATSAHTDQDNAPRNIILPWVLRRSKKVATSRYRHAAILSAKTRTSSHVDHGATLAVVRSFHHVAYGRGWS